ncbi:hypothetical protein EVAR_45657_1 [Eumeta japonica]|uniref:Uncharacterized protein n=1 Tax=Eumeta variegata TaxID=151549 RepID=A0A4C1Y4F7_EUMVA|nr:hypothetical protein EVAR_45657_1 [Eumeta japonica]
MRLGSLIGDCPPSIKSVTINRRCRPCLRKSTTPILNSIPNDIISTDDIDNVVRALTNHIRTVVENSSKVVLAKSDRRELPGDVSEIISYKNAALRRAGKYPTCDNKYHARALQSIVKARMKEARNDN